MASEILRERRSDSSSATGLRLCNQQEPSEAGHSLELLSQLSERQQFVCLSGRLDGKERFRSHQRGSSLSGFVDGRRTTRFEWFLLSQSALGFDPFHSDWHPASAEIREYCKKASEHCKSRQLNLSKLAVQFSLKDERISTNLIGARNSEQLRELLSWAEEEVDDAQISQVQEILQPIKNKTWPMGTEENASLCSSHAR
eukprot:TRINITY_DN1822_c0_g1_i1.p1 TRINITY_DN1822_c0_g1~~TRINITY_DN1822_c0_g1_i1.p1  ORF type:complete len:199 (+),score=27.98 TRINITY_DN1822_c0_g1_i1:877-1473(+)